MQIEKEIPGLFLNKASTTRTLLEEFSVRVRKEQKKQKLTQIMPVVILFALFSFFSIALPNSFLTLYNMTTMLNQLSITLIIGIGITFVLLTGSLDLSVEGVLALGGCMLAIVVLNNKNSLDLGFFGVIIAILTGVACGLISGLIHVKLKVISFMVTYGMSTIGMGVALMTYGGYISTVEDKSLLKISTIDFLGIPAITWIALVLLLISWIIQSRTRFGRYMYAIGTNEQIPRITGINVDRVKVMVFMWSGMCAAIAGILSVFRLGYGIIDIGYDQFFPAQAAVVVGGTALSGGRGGVINTLVGTMIITVLEVGLLLMGVNAFIRSGLQGLIIVVALILTVRRGPRLISK